MELEQLQQALKSGYGTGKRFKHKKAELIRLFPYVTTSLKTAEENDLRSYAGISGEVVRQLMGVERLKDFNFENVSSALGYKVEADAAEMKKLIDMVRTVAFSSAGHVTPFSLRAFPYIGLEKDSPVMRAISCFHADILFAAHGVRVESDQFASESDENVLHKLIHSCLPDLLDAAPGGKTCRYSAVEVGLSEVFQRDWGFLCSRPDLLHTYLPKFLQLYGMLYQLRAVERLNDFFRNEPLKPIYFTLDWETCSASRIAYVGGWKRMEPQIKTLYSHVNCLELLNHITGEGLKAPFTYLDLKDWCDRAGHESKVDFEGQLACITAYYKEEISNLSNGSRWEGWEAYEPFSVPDYGEEILVQARKLYELVNCQFVHSSRGRASDGYANWLIRFVVSNFIKRRGRIGYTLAFSRDQIMFLTRLVVGNKPKLRLHEFWEEVRARGVDFDHESKRLIVELFEQLNLLEKKSDSGDAQYVRAVI